MSVADNLGSIPNVAEHDATNSTTGIVNHLAYNAFGKLTGETNAAVDHHFSYAGRELDDETGLDYQCARYYDGWAELSLTTS